MKTAECPIITAQNARKAYRRAAAGLPKEFRIA